MSTEPKLYKFTENNDWEGEEWEFFVLLADGEHAVLVELLEKVGEYNESYTLSEETFTEEEVRVLVDNADEEGYMPSHNYAGRVANPLPEAADFEESDPFYKGRFAEEYCSIKGCELWT